MLSLFDLQTQSGQLWPDIADALAEKDATISAQAVQISELQATIETAKALYLAMDKAGIEALIADTAKTAAQKRAEECAAQIAALTAEIESLNLPPE